MGFPRGVVPIALRLLLSFHTYSGVEMSDESRIAYLQQQIAALTEKKQEKVDRLTEILHLTWHEGKSGQEMPIWFRSVVDCAFSPERNWSLPVQITDDDSLVDLYSKLEGLHRVL